LRALGFEPKEDEIKKLLSSVNQSDEDETNKKGYSADTIDFDKFLKIMSAKLRESEEIDKLAVGFFSFCDNTLSEQDKYITLSSLRAVAKTLNEEVSDEELKEMMIEANPELKSQGSEYFFL
jgi:Ca2+-binding EF-hand superfamily protein